jgi:uncharacterized protein (DUF58 family)
MIRFLSLLSFLLAGLTASAQTGPQAEFDTKLHNFGKVVEGEKPKHTFMVKNTGDKPLLIKRVRPSCGCTTPGWTREPIAPGEEGKITAQYNSSGRPGNFHKSITVYTNVGEGKSFRLSIKGVVKNKKEGKATGSNDKAKQIRLQEAH